MEREAWEKDRKEWVGDTERKIERETGVGERKIERYRVGEKDGKRER